MNDKPPLQWEAVALFLVCLIFGVWGWYWFIQFLAWLSTVL